ncbi:uncharacterized protein A4U43_C07F11010 [Asparagus officinalis]|uniref:DYW domain-containing protein n=1 Tax=Asparagus officinalis TaxID=4686 RepID=A0A5P1EEB3_ASPOF|nr:uncharacterized protein A4U43_C07F11010 [Asparagus officinalis]
MNMQVDGSVTLNEALLLHDKLLENKAVKYSDFDLVTWDDWDCGKMLESECRLKGIRKPLYFNRVIELDSTNSGRYILLANLYASVGRWDDVAKIRVLMNELGVKKEPGWSVIEFDGAINEFIAGGMSHPEAKEIYAKVDEMLDAIRLEGYVPDIGGVLHDIKEEEKENPLHYHSEKLAIGFGLLKTKPGETIRISKNLRVCKDCHYASKIISRAYDREIVVRDRNRFHHFRGGVCSCKDYW